MSLAVEHDEGMTAKLNNIITGNAGGMRVRLFKNNVVPTRGDVVALFTEANFSGYAAQAPGYGAAATDANSNAEAVAPALAFTHNGGATANTVYGAYQTDSTGKVMWSIRFSAPVVFAANGDSESVTPKMYCGQIVPPV